MIRYWLKYSQALLDSRGGNIAPTSQWEEGKEFVAICFKTTTPTRQEIQAMMVRVLYTTISPVPRTVTGM